jgi:hypothetical protein
MAYGYARMYSSDALMDYWGSGCPLPGITESALLRAWANCTDAQRIDVHSGSLRSVL